MNPLPFSGFIMTSFTLNQTRQELPTESDDVTFVSQRTFAANRAVNTIKGSKAMDEENDDINISEEPVQKTRRKKKQGLLDDWLERSNKKQALLL